MTKLGKSLARSYTANYALRLAGFMSRERPGHNSARLGLYKSREN
jgi:hypothetical protein